MTVLAFDTRRNAVKTLPNPSQLHDYVIQHEAQLVAAHRNIKLLIRMVPDRDILDEAALKDYLGLFSASDSPLETLASHILDDLLDTLIPRLLQIELNHQKNGQIHRVVMEEKQPKWNNPGLLTRLAPI